MIIATDRNKSLDQLEGVVWGEPNYDSHLIIKCFELRKKPIGNYSVEDLRLTIGQGIGLIYLIPIALEVVEKEPLAQGDLFPGDLLSSLLKVNHSFWKENPSLHEEFEIILQGIPTFSPNLFHDFKTYLNGLNSIHSCAAIENTFAKLKNTLLTVYRLRNTWYFDQKSVANENVVADGEADFIGEFISESSIMIRFCPYCGHDLNAIK